MLAPPYSDGARFEGVTGPTVVTRWLDADAARRFVFVYSPASAGWREGLRGRDLFFSSRPRNFSIGTADVLL